MYILYILFAILLFSFLIAIHEFGHFITAKLSGVKVNEFSIFMGPAIFQRQRGETLYSIRTIPIGGYCAMEGEDSDSDDPRSFGKARWWKKIVILFAGAGMNFLAGFLMTLLVISLGAGAVIPTATIESFSPGNVVEGENGLHVGDTLYALDGRRIFTSSDFTTLASINLRDEGYTHDLTVIRDGRKVLLDDFHLEPVVMVDAEGNEQLRYGLNLVVAERTAGTVISYAWNNTLSYAQSVPLSLVMLFTGKASVADTGGPVMITKMVADVATTSGSIWAGVLNAVSFMSMIAVTLAMMNLLPIPALDGGHIVSVLITAAIEGVTGKKLDPKYESYVHGVGMVLLFVLMAVVFLKDIIQLFI